MKLIMIGLVVLVFATFSVAESTWHGLTILEENRCSVYNKKKQYPYPASIEIKIVEDMGGQIYGPYTGTYFNTIKETDIEHIVAASEGHDSGLCRASAETRAAFAQDPLNLTLASPRVNRCSKGGKCGFDAAEWLPKVNQCWYAGRVIAIKKKYKLSIDESEKQALHSIIQKCDNFEMEFLPKENSNKRSKITTEINQTVIGEALQQYDDNSNGRISCAEARNHRIAPVINTHIAYPYMIDRNGDGIVCE